MGHSGTSAIQARREQSGASAADPLAQRTGSFRAYCASCHGVDAKGNGPAAAALKVKVPDLTLLATRNGGTFPATLVRKVILGDNTVVAHGSREMPVWGPIFHQVEEDVDRGNVRIANLVQYLASTSSAVATNLANGNCYLQNEDSRIFCF
jgi:mono/diheme cytochrome c family protein